MTGQVPAQLPRVGAGEQGFQSAWAVCHMLEPGPNWDTAHWQRRGLGLYLETVGPTYPHCSL